MRPKNGWLWGGALILAVVLLVFWPWSRALRISDERTGRLLWCERMQIGETFVLAYIHSVNRRPVYDTLRVADDHLVIVGSRFDAFGAGMPEGSSQDGELSVAPDGWLIYRVERPVPDIVVRVGRVAEHTLHIKGVAIPLVRLAPPGTALRLSIYPTALIDVIKGRYMQWT